MEGFTPSVLMMIILAVIIGFAVGCFFMKQREKIKEAKKKLHTSEQEHEEDEDNEYEEEIVAEAHRRILGVLCALLHFVRCLFPCAACAQHRFFLHQL